MAGDEIAAASPFDKLRVRTPLISTVLMLSLSEHEGPALGCSTTVQRA
jgi:hypothetical protein